MSTATSTALPMNPAARNYPNEFIQTGISTIDGLNTLVRGQKLPIFSGSRPAARAAWPRRSRDRRRCWTARATLPLSLPPSASHLKNLSSSSTNSSAPAPSTARCCSSNLANDPAVERIATPRMALTAAEYLAFDCGMHVLVILTDITNYAEALREVSARRKRRSPAAAAIPAICTPTLRRCTSARAVRWARTARSR